jgi:hypothetical protein
LKSPRLLSKETLHTPLLAPQPLDAFVVDIPAVVASSVVGAAKPPPGCSLAHWRNQRRSESGYEAQPQSGEPTLGHDLDRPPVGGGHRTESPPPTPDSAHRQPRSATWCWRRCVCCGAAAVPAGHIARQPSHVAVHARRSSNSEKCRRPVFRSASAWSISAPVSSPARSSPTCTPSTPAAR